MTIMLGLIASAVITAALAIVLFIAYVNWTNDRAAVRRQLVRREQRLAEARMQQVMQESVEQMFKTVREQS